MSGRKRLRNKTALVDDEAEEDNSGTPVKRERVDLSGFGASPRARASGRPEHVLIKVANNRGLVKVIFKYSEEINAVLRAIESSAG